MRRSASTVPRQAIDPLNRGAMSGHNAARTRDQIPSAPIRAVAASSWRDSAGPLVTRTPSASSRTSTKGQPSRSSMSGCFATSAASAAVNHPVGSIGISRQRQAGNFDAARAAHHPHRVRHDRGCRKRRMQAEADENARCVGRELQAGACFLKHGRLFENDDAAAGRGQRQRGGQPSDPGTGDDDGRASCRHGNVRRPCRSPRIPAGGPHPARDR